MSSPAERFAAARVRREQERSPLGRFVAGAGVRARTTSSSRRCRPSPTGTACWSPPPPGAGKTVVGEFAVDLALRTGRKAFYTTPIKALSNQKYADLVAVHGADAVGLLTGDVSRERRGARGGDDHRGAPQHDLRGLLDPGRSRVRRHGRGALPRRPLPRGGLGGGDHPPGRGRAAGVAVGDGEQRRGVRRVAGHRPRRHPRRGLRAPAGAAVAARPGRQAAARPVRRPRRRPGARPARRADPGLVNPELVALAREESRYERRYQRPAPARREPATATRHAQPRRRGRGAGQGRPAAGHPLHLQPQRLRRRRPPVPRLGRPAHHAGGAGRDPARRRGAHAGPARRRPRRPRLVGVGRRRSSGGSRPTTRACCPAFKETVEELFRRGLVKIVFATETLALGVNMPARSVVLEKLVKWNGEQHVDVTAGEYTQLTGRAGRRGIDVEGHAVVLWTDGLQPDHVACLASTRTYPLRSSFAPTYSMAVNLVARVGREGARSILETSFAQFQADRGVVGLARQLRKQEEALAGYTEAMHCHLGDFDSYHRLRSRISATEKDLSKRASADRRADAAATLERLRRGDVIDVPTGKQRGWAVVLDPGLHADGPRPTVLTADRQVRRLDPVLFPAAVQVVATVRVPKHFDAHDTKARRDLASSMRNALAAVGGGNVAAARPAPRRRRRGGHRARRAGAATAATGAAGAPVPRLRRPRGPRPLGPATRRARARPPHPAAQDLGPDRRDRPDLRPGLRGPRRARLPGRGGADRGGAGAALHLHAVRPARRGVPADRYLGRPGRPGAGCRRVDPGVRGPPRGRGRRPPPARAGARRPRGRRRYASGQPSPTSRRGPPGATRPGSPTPGSPPRCGGGRRASRWRPCCGRAT